MDKEVIYQIFEVLMLLLYGGVVFVAINTVPDPDYPTAITTADQLSYLVALNSQTDNKLKINFEKNVEITSEENQLKVKIGDLIPIERNYFGEEEIKIEKEGNSYAIS